jgi:hypothetical protein
MIAARLFSQISPRWQGGAGEDECLVFIIRFLMHPLFLFPTYNSRNQPINARQRSYFCRDLSISFALVGPALAVSCLSASVIGSDD